jgi:chromosome segregation ATPase
MMFLAPPANGLQILFCRGDLAVNRRHLVFTLLLAIVVVGCLSGEALARHGHYGRGRGNSGAASRARMLASVQAQVAYARAVLADAEVRASAAQAGVDSANQRISGARDTLASASSDEKKAHEALVEAEAAVIDAAGEDSEIGQAKKKTDDLRQAMQYEQNRVLNSDAYKSKIAESSGTAEHAALVPKIRGQMLQDDAEYQRALSKYEVAKQNFSRLRTEVVHKDQTWLSHSSEIKDAWVAERTATNEGIAGGMKKLPAKQTLHEAQRTAAEARAYVAQGEMILRALGGTNRGNRTGSTPSASSLGTNPGPNFFSK